MTDLPVPLETNEHVTWSGRATHVQSGRAVGGRLFLTDRRLVFGPNTLDRSAGGRTWTGRLADIVDVGEQPRTWKIFDGRLRPRLRVEIAGDGEALFMVKDRAAVAAHIRAAAQD